VLRRWASDIGCESVAALTTPILQAWFNAKLKTTKIQTAAAYIYQISTFLNWCRNEREILTINVADKVRIPKYTKNVRRDFLSLAQAQRLLDSCDDQELKFALYCSLHAGFRMIECTQAKPEWFNVNARLIHVQCSDTWMTKNGKNRVIPMSTEFSKFLAGYMAQLKPGAQFMMAPDKLAARRHRYRTDFTRRYEGLTRRLGLGHCRYHSLRRTFASLKVSAGVSLFKVATWCGHRTSVCEESYAHLIPLDSQIDVGLERV
jgi:integrase